MSKDDVFDLNFEFGFKKFFDTKDRILPIKTVQASW